MGLLSCRDPSGLACRCACECFRPRQNRCLISGETVSDSPVAIRGVGERGPLGPPLAGRPTIGYERESRLRNDDRTHLGQVPCHMTIVMQDQKDPACVFVLVIFESEEKTRARETDPRRQEGVQALRTSLAEILDAAPEYSDLNVIADLVP